MTDALRFPKPGLAARTSPTLFCGSYRREQHPLMNGLQRTARIAPAINVATIVFVGAIVGGSAVGLAAAAYASPCDPVTMSMTPQPVLSCPGPDVAPPAEGSPVPVPVNGLAGPPADGVPVVEPVADVAGPPPPAALPHPGQPPSVPPVVNEDGTPQTFGQGGFLRDIWHQFHNGVPSDLFYGPVPPPADPAVPPPPGDPLLLPPSGP